MFFRGSKAFHLVFNVKEDVISSKEWLSCRPQVESIKNIKQVCLDHGLDCQFLKSDIEIDDTVS